MCEEQGVRKQVKDRTERRGEVVGTRARSVCLHQFATFNSQPRPFPPPSFIVYNAGKNELYTRH